jgi:hypothetical protein
MRVVKRSLIAALAVCLAGALAVPGCGSNDTDSAGDTQSAAVAEPTPEPTLEPSEPEPDDAVDTAWMAAFNDVAVTADGLVYASAQIGIAALDGSGEWTIVDVDGLPEGPGVEEWLPGRSITNLATGPDGELWAAGWAHSTVDDEEFGGTINGWVEARDLSWVARRDCVADEYSWEVFTSNDTPELRTSYGTSELAAAVGDLAIAADGTLYASVGHNQLAVYDGSGWETHFVPDPTTGYRATIAPWSNSLAVGADGLLWAGTNSAPSVTGRGLFTFDGADFTRLTTDDGLPSDQTFQVSVGGDGTVWVATDVLYSDVETASPDQAAGVASFDGTSWTTYTMDEGLLSNDGVVAAGPDGTVWVVHGEIAPRGYGRFDGTGWTAYPSDPPVGRFRAVVDSEGTLWSAAETGIVRFDGTTKTVFPSPFITVP